MERHATGASQGSYIVIASALQVHLDSAGAYRRRQSCVVSLGLIGIGESKLPHRLVELILLAEIAADCPGIARLSVRSREDPAAGPGVDRQHFCVIGLDQGAQLHIAQLTQVEVAPLWSCRPSEEQI